MPSLLTLDQATAPTIGGCVLLRQPKFGGWPDHVICTRTTTDVHYSRPLPDGRTLEHIISTQQPDAGLQVAATLCAMGYESVPFAIPELGVHGTFYALPDHPAINAHAA
jgi:hypothetical protein